MKSWHLLILFLLGVFKAKAQFTNPLPIPDTLSGPIFQLSFKNDSSSFFQGHKTKTYAYGNDTFLGPTLILRRGWNISPGIFNQSDDTTTLHWHGLHIPAHADGGPHSPILSGQTWEPHFTCLDKAGTYWYHPHFHGKTGKQTMKGAAGLIIVRDGEEAQLPLPRTYGKDDFPIILQSLQFDPNQQIIPNGLQDSILLVNGTQNPYLNVPGQWLRFRILNASNARNFRIGFSENLPFYVIGNDGGLLGRPVALTRCNLAPGERIECMIDLTGRNGQTLHLRSFASEIPAGTQGGPLGFLPPGTPPMSSPLNGIDFSLLELRVGQPLPGLQTQLPDSLVNFQRLEESSSVNERFFRFASVVPGSPAGPFVINDSVFSMERVDFSVPVGNTEIWSLHNQTVVAHPFHLHGFSFFILDRFGAPPAPEEAGRKDMVQLAPNEQVRIISRFNNFADTTMPYMYHCHILHHEDEGMMGQFVVKPLISQAKKNIGKSPQNLGLVHNILPWKGSEPVEIWHISGSRTGTFHATEDGIHLAHLPAGSYLALSGKRFFRFQKI
jgi:bilirubin oxidase